MVRLDDDPGSAERAMFPARPSAKGCALVLAIPALLGVLAVVIDIAIVITGRFEGLSVVGLGIDLILTLTWAAAARYVWRRADRPAFR
jgi:hypothetical protein